MKALVYSLLNHKLGTDTKESKKSKQKKNYNSRYINFSLPYLSIPYTINKQ